jgi:hypothetical protein
MAYRRAFYKKALYPLLERVNAYVMRWMRKKLKRLRGRKKAQTAWNQAVTRRPKFFAHWAWTTHAPSSGDQNDKSRMTRDCHVRICEGRGMRFPRLLGRPGDC